MFIAQFTVGGRAEKKFGSGPRRVGGPPNDRLVSLSLDCLTKLRIEVSARANFPINQPRKSSRSKAVIRYVARNFYITTPRIARPRVTQYRNDRSAGRNISSFGTSGAKRETVTASLHIPDHTSTYFTEG